MRVVLLLIIISAVYGRIIFEKYTINLNKAYGNVSMRIDNSPTSSFLTVNSTLEKTIRGRIMVIENQPKCANKKII
jgi:hypothetical protein